MLNFPFFKHGLFFSFPFEESYRLLGERISLVLPLLGCGPPAYSCLYVARDSLLT